MKMVVLLCFSFFLNVVCADEVKYLRASADMSIDYSLYGFSDVEAVKIELYENEEQKPVSFIISFTEKEGGQLLEKIVELKINGHLPTTISDTFYGSKLQEDRNQIKSLPRFKITLTDFSKSQSLKWEALITRGYGSVGVFEDRMELTGVPVPEQ